MPLIFKKGDIFAEKFDIIINPCNCVGIAGAGLSLEFRVKYPKNYDQYKIDCNDGKYKPGNIYLYYDEYGKYKGQGQWIINFTTKDHWKNPSKIEWIKSGLIQLHDYLQNNIEKPPETIGPMYYIGIPALGSGLGKLPWIDVKLLIEKYLGDLPWEITIFEPLN